MPETPDARERRSCARKRREKNAPGIATAREATHEDLLRRDNSARILFSARAWNSGVLRRPSSARKDSREREREPEVVRPEDEILCRYPKRSCKYAREGAREGRQATGRRTFVLYITSAGPYEQARDNKRKNFAKTFLERS